MSIYEPDERGYWGEFGGRFVPETLVAPLDELTAGYFALNAARFAATKDLPSWGTELVTSTHDGRIQVRAAASGALLRETVRPGLLFTQRCRDGGHLLASGYAGMRGMEMLGRVCAGKRRAMWRAQWICTAATFG